MNVLNLMAALRKIFSYREIPELPPFPASLFASWCHPDFYLSMSGNTLGQCFTFQTFAISDGFLADTTIKTPDMIWLADRTSLPLSNGITEFLASLKNELLPGREDADFAIVSDSRRKLFKGEAGSFWKILFAGVECGRLSHYSSIPGSALPDYGSMVVTMQLNVLSALLSPILAVDKALWAGNVAVSSSLAMLAWQKSEEKSFEDDKQLFELLNNALASSEKDAATSFCRIFKLYNEYGHAINKNAEICQTFAAKLSTLSTELLAAGDANVA